MSLGVNDHHQGTVVNYMRFARYQRGQRLRSVDACFNELKDSRLTENTFTIDEVEEMLDGLLAVVRGEVETELINTAHTNVLLLRQMFTQAEKWHLKLQADISELENRELLEAIKDFEEAEFAGASRDSDKLKNLKLQPVNMGGSELLNMEIQRLQDENEKLRERMKGIESQALSASQQKSALRDDLDRAQSELEKAKNRKPDYDSGDMDNLRSKMSGLQSSFEKSKLDSDSKAKRLEEDLASSKHEYLKIQEMLDMAEKELEKKVSQTAPFKNLKQMLQKKNEQIKDLRKRLNRYEDDD